MRIKSGLGVVAALAALCAVVPPAAVAAGPEFTIYASVPNYVEAGDSTYISFAVVNTGDVRSTGPIVMTDTVSPGMAPPKQSFFETFVISTQYPEEPEEEEHEGSCETSGSTTTCTVDDALPPGAQIQMPLMGSVDPGVSGVLANTITVSAGNVAPVEAVQRINVGATPAFGFDQFAASLAGPGGEPLSQAASDPANLTTTLRFDTEGGTLYGVVPMNAAVEKPKNVAVHLPAGFVGNPTATPVRCTAAELNETGGPGHESIPKCPNESQVGVAHVELGGTSVLTGVYNVVPPASAASELGFNILGTVVALDAYVRPGDNGIDIVSRNTSTTIPLTEVAVTVWGDPASPSHDRLRGECLGRGNGADGASCPSTAHEEAFLRMPTSCSGAGIPFGVGATTYEKPAAEVTAASAGPILTGCENVPFNPSIYVQPTTSVASSTSGVAVQMSVPQSSNPESIAEADLKKAVVTMPEGMTIDPSSADGLQACTDRQLRLGQAGPSECPDAAKIGRVELHTPLLENAIEGSIWLRTQNSFDPASGEMFRIAIELRDDRHGIDIKLPGQVAANPSTGQLTTTFDDAPQLPFDSITLHFKAGARSPLSTPPTCGVKTTVADLYSWAQPETPVQRTIPFEITSGPEGKACGATQFSPGFNAGVKSVHAGGFTPFLTTFSRTDADQQMERITVHLPEGLMGSLSGLPLCGEAQANAGTCPTASQIGTATAGAGVGPTPFYVTGGKVFMTGPYKGAPFGLSVVVPAKAGPFDLGTVVVRAKVDVDPQTAALTVTTDQLPKIVAGVPVDLRLINVSIDRPNFTFNPTSCAPMSVKATVDSFEGASVPVENRFQVANCARLPFQPSFEASTSAKTSRKDGASLHVRVAYPHGAVGSDANLAYAKVELPRALPSELKTLKLACLAKVFEANPAGCPKESVVGHAVVHTPVLPVPLEGPAYFVSEGTEWPELIMVLQGYGVTVELVGETRIKKGITSSTFKSTPDVPFESFELTLPEQEYSALAANGNLCDKKLAMPTHLVGQNGAEIDQKTPIEVQGCPNKISILGARLRGRTLRIRLTVPGKGTLKASGKGLVAVKKSAQGREQVALKLRLEPKEIAQMRRGAHGKRKQKLETKVKLTFRPVKGRKIVKKIEARI